MQAAGRSNSRWASRSRPGSSTMTASETLGPSATGAHRTEIESSDALPQIPQLDVV